MLPPLRGCQLSAFEIILMSPRPSAGSFPTRPPAADSTPRPVIASRFALAVRIHAVSRVAVAVGVFALLAGHVLLGGSAAVADEPNPAETDGRPDKLRGLQTEAMTDSRAAWGQWGTDPAKYSTWTNHSNCLIPVYTFGVTLNRWRGEGSAYADPDRLAALYGEVPEGSLNPSATYYDQIDLYRLQQDLIDVQRRRLG